MNHIVTLVLVTLWVVANFYLWSFKQSHLALFWQSLGMAAVAYPAFFWYVGHTPKIAAQRRVSGSAKISAQ